MPLLSGDARQPAVPQGPADALRQWRAALPTALADWRAIFATLGLSIQPVETGCCGMAGLFGHDVRNQEMSRNLFAASWDEPLWGENDMLATGFSCRCQVGRFSATRARHPMALIAEAFAQPSG